MFTRKVHQGRLQLIVVVIVLSLVVPLTLSSTAISSVSASPKIQVIQGEPRTPLQIELAEAISQRQAAGLPAPAVTFSAQPDGVQSLDQLSLPQARSLSGKATTVTNTTVIDFSGPQEAGYDTWPALNISGELAGDAANTFATGDLSEVIRKGVEEKIPGFWQQVDFGKEPRKYSITETNVLSPASGEPLLAPSLLNPAQASTDGDILLGFTYTGPNIDYSVEYEAEACIPWTDLCAQLFYLKAGFEFDWALGLRLPANATLTGPDQVEQGSDAYYQTSLTPQDWDASQYSAYGVAAEGGNEFVLRFKLFAGILVKIFGEEVCPPGFICSVNFDVDRSTSFTTPFGAGSSFPIPPIEIPIYTLDTVIFNFSTSLTIRPLLTSTQIMADWSTVSGSDCAGSGSVTYTEPGAAVTFGPVSVCNLDMDPNTNQAQVELDNFRYYFNEFKIEMGAKVAVDVFSVYQKTIEGTVFTLDLSNIFGGLGLYVGDHMQCTWDFDCSRAGPANKIVLTSTTKDETPPTTTIELQGDEGANGWYVSDIQFSLSAEDPCGSGVQKIEYSFDNSAWMPYNGPVTFSIEGINTVYYRSADIAGNFGADSQVIKIDKTPPVITGAPTTLPNGFGWWKTDVVIHFDATDPISGIAWVTPDVTISTEGENQSVLGAAVDMAGNEAQMSVGDINIDKTPPLVAILNPLPLTYNNTDAFNVAWTAADTLSGIDTESGDLDGSAVANGQLIDLRLVSAGDHTITVIAVDKAGNVTNVSVAFFVQVDINGLISSVETMCQEGWIQSPGICNSLLAKLNNAKSAIDRRQCSVAENVLNAFIDEVEGQNEKGLTVEAANVLKANALYVIEHLECTSTSP